MVIEGRSSPVEYHHQATTTDPSESTTRHRDSVNGLPNKNLQEEQEMSANVSFQTYDDQQVEFFTGQCRQSSYGF